METSATGYMVMDGSEKWIWKGDSLVAETNTEFIREGPL